METQNSFRDVQETLDYYKQIKREAYKVKREAKKEGLTFEFKLKKPTNQFKLLDNIFECNKFYRNVKMKLQNIEREKKEKKLKKIFIKNNNYACKANRKARKDGFAIKAVSINGVETFDSHAKCARDLGIPEASFNHMLRRDNSINVTGYDFILKSGKIVKSHTKVDVYTAAGYIETLHPFEIMKKYNLIMGDYNRLVKIRAERNGFVFSIAGHKYNKMSRYCTPIQVTEKNGTIRKFANAIQTAKYYKKPLPAILSSLNIYFDIKGLKLKRLPEC